ncbi:MAG: toll/interleukin-1 receptor domain-containing protein [Chloroflexi bacterium]|nr:MAG: toll/interleukin-1 receptor domain-containing protein [Chloroflexota bacterium]
MARAFISYKHKSNLDERLATYFERYLTGKKHDVFIDKEIMLGQEWPTTIEQEIKASDFLIVLLSEQSIVSEMVIQEVRMAHSFKKIILPVQVAFDASLPYDLGAYLNRIQWVDFTKQERWDSAMQELLIALDAPQKNVVKQDVSARNSQFRQYDTSVIRKMLDEAFDSDELMDFLFDHFRPLYDRLDPGITKRLTIQKLIAYAEEQNLLESLLDYVARKKPRQYRRFAGMLEIDE